MADAMYLAILVAFFAVAFAFVRACERIIGPVLDAEPTTTTVDPATADQAAA